MDGLSLALVIVAGVLGVVEVIRSRAQSLLAWAVVALSLALLLPEFSIGG